MTDTLTCVQNPAYSSAAFSFYSKTSVLRCFLSSYPLKTMFQHKASTDKLYADSFFIAVQDNYKNISV